jgi:hypothetical protein
VLLVLSPIRGFKILNGLVSENIASSCSISVTTRSMSIRTSIANCQSRTSDSRLLRTTKLVSIQIAPVVMS